MKRRNNKGQYTIDIHSHLMGFYLLCTTVAIGAYLQNHSKVMAYVDNIGAVELESPHISSVYYPSANELEAEGWKDAKIVPLEELAEKIEPTKAPKQAQKLKPDTNYDHLFQQYFGDDWKTARAIAMAESHMNWNREGIHKAGKYTWSTDSYPGECSIGAMQVNLASDACNGKRAHWNKVPGETLQEKIAWLKVPENNLKIAAQIYQAQGFNPWSTYKDGKYQKYMD